MFLENKYARPLFDFEKGGPPKAFQCLMFAICPVCLESPCTYFHGAGSNTERCNKVTRTERGMRMHLKIVHGWKEQPCLYSTDKDKIANESSEPRKLRISPKPIKETKQKNVHQQSEKNEQESLPLMKEEN